MYVDGQYTPLTQFIIAIINYIIIGNYLRYYINATSIINMPYLINMIVIAEKLN
jgi:hypothetical protein